MRWWKSSAAPIEANAGINRAVEKIGGEVESHRDERTQQDNSLHDEEIASEDRLHGDLPEPGPGENGLDDDGAGEKIGNLQRRDGDHGNGGVAGEMPSKKLSHRHPPGTGRADVVFGEFIQ